MIRRDEQRPRKRRPLRLVEDELAASQPRARPAVASPALPLLNRELSWLAFNERVLEEAYDERWPLLERLKFLAISETNLDEFFMIRVSGLLDQLSSEIVEPTDDGLPPAEALARVRAAVQEHGSAADVVPRRRSPAEARGGGNLDPHVERPERRAARGGERALPAERPARPHAARRRSGASVSRSSRTSP